MCGEMIDMICSIFELDGLHGQQLKTTLLECTGASEGAKNTICKG